MTNTLIGRMPKVAICSLLEGRGNRIHESLEEQTMNLPLYKY